MAASQDALDRLPDIWKRVLADDDAARGDLIDAVLSLDAWYTVPQAQAAQVRPVASIIEGVPMLLAFTSEAKALAFVAEQDLDLGTLKIEAKTPRQVIAQYPDLSAAGIQAVIFDVTESGIFVRLSQLTGTVADEDDTATEDEA